MEQVVADLLLAALPARPAPTTLTSACPAWLDIPFLALFVSPTLSQMWR
jgi:hypothetical protein